MNPTPTGDGHSVESQRYANQSNRFPMARPKDDYGIEEAIQKMTNLD